MGTDSCAGSKSKNVQNNDFMLVTHENFGARHLAVGLSEA